MLASEIRYEELAAESLPRLTRLRVALLESGCKVLDEDQVKAYQAEKTRLANEAAVRRVQRGTPISFAVTAVLLVVAGLCARVPGHHVWAGVVGGGSLGLSVWTLLQGFFFLKETRMRRHPQWSYRWQWVSAGLSGFSTYRPIGGASFQVPPHVAALANRLATRSGATPYVEYFQQDPFVYLADGWGQRYYVAVWDETGFCQPPPPPAPGVGR